MNYNKTLQELLEDFQEQAWYEFHASHINEQDDFYTFMHEWVDNAVIYTHDCENILENNSEYHYLEHDIFGRPNNIAQAVYACLYDYFIENDGYLWNEMEEVLENTLQDAE